MTTLFGGPSRLMGAFSLSNQEDTFLERRNKLLNFISVSKDLVEDLRTMNRTPNRIQYPFASPGAIATHPSFRQPSFVSLTPSKSLSRDNLNEIGTGSGPEDKGLVSLSRQESFRDKLQILNFDSKSDFYKQGSTIANIVAASSSGSYATSTTPSLLPPSSSLTTPSSSMGSSPAYLTPTSTLGSAPSPSSTTNTSDTSPEVPLVSQHLDLKFWECLSYLDKLSARISDKRSKILVTGDLNAGKSTLVNALLRRPIVPQDQQPCTAMFCEVIDYRENDFKEEVHGIVDLPKYNRSDPTTFTRFELGDLKKIVADDMSPYYMLKVYCQDYCKDETNNTSEHTPKQSTESKAKVMRDSLLHNGVVDVTLIDSPGLNIDLSKTLALFSQQEEIDIVLFVVHAENQFTLSGTEFLEAVGKDKAYVFMVANRFDQIEDKKRCKKDILEQIKRISPATYAAADHLVHFVSAKKRLQACAAKAATSSRSPSPTQSSKDEEEAQFLSDFDFLEASLKSFIFEKRQQSKLLPAKKFLQTLMSDITILSKYNTGLLESRHQQLASDIHESTPVYERLLVVKEQFLDDIDKTIDDTCLVVNNFALDQLSNFVMNIEIYAMDIEWKGALYAWSFASEVKDYLCQLAINRLRKSEEYAKDAAMTCLNNIQNLAASCSVPTLEDREFREIFEVSTGPTSSLSDSSLEQTSSTDERRAPPSLSTIGMKSQDGANTFSSSTSSFVTANSSFEEHSRSVTTFNGNTGASGSRDLMLTNPVLIELADFFDYGDKVDVLKSYIPSVAMIFSGLVGYNKVFSSAVAFSGGSSGLSAGLGLWSLLGSGRTGGSSGRSWLGLFGGVLAIGLTAVGFGAFFFAVSDMPHVISRKISRKMRNHLRDIEFIETNTTRINRGTRRVLRLGLWEYQNRFQKVLEEKTFRRTHLFKEKGEVEKILATFEKISQRATDINAALDEMDLEGARTAVKL